MSQSMIIVDIWMWRKMNWWTLGMDRRMDDWTDAFARGLESEPDCINSHIHIARSHSRGNF
jgi:hypothetical protein